MKTSAVIKCTQYELSAVEEALARGLALLGGMEKFIKPGAKVLIKANLIMKAQPEKAMTTHPAVIAALAKAVIKAGGIALIGDSPGGPAGGSRIQAIYEVSGMKWAAEQSGAELVLDMGGRDAFFPEGVILKKMTLTNMALDADLVISAAKLKTHGMTTMSGAIKNLYGCVPGTLKVEYHYRMPELQSFSNMLLDICEFIRPVLSVVDGIVGMEGEGPTAGVPRPVGALIVADDPYAADFAAVSLMGCKPEDICFFQRAVERGIVEKDFSDIALTGDAIEELAVKDFDIPSLHNTKLLNKFVPAFLRQCFDNMMDQYPVVQKELCRSCGECAAACPPKAITMTAGKPSIDYNVCIRCFCCQELCPFKAMRIKRPLLFRWMK